MNSIKQTITMAAMSALQAIVRNTPPGRLRRLAWEAGDRHRLVNFVTEANGIVVAGNTHDIIQRYLYWFGVWEPNLTDFIMRRMGEAPDRVFVDVGANIGYFSALVAKSYPRTNVVSIEAFPPTVEKLRLTIGRNDVKNVRVIETAVSDTQGSLEFFYAGPENEGATTTVQGRFKSTGVPVPCKPLSELLTDGEIAATRLVKIDVEGAESQVIKGFAPILALMPNDVEVIVEISGDCIERTQFIFDVFNAHDFHAYEIVNEYNPLSYLYKQALKRPQRISAIPSSQTDVVFSRSNHECL